MVTNQEAVRLWEDNVGDSGEAPTGYELTAYANVVHKKAIQPALDLAEAWTKRAAELEEKANWMSSTGQTTLSNAMHYRIRAYRYLASEVIGTLTDEV